MIVYAESSAVLACLFGETRADAVREALDAATVVVLSDLTRIECARAIHRAVALGALTSAAGEALRETCGAASAEWDQITITEPVVERASEGFPVEPIRVLDAVHLASALVARSAWKRVSVLSLDEHVRTNAAALGSRCCVASCLRM